jgi:hypothetical protein
LVAILGLVVGLSGCWWSQRGFGAASTGHNPFERTIAAGNVRTMVEAWTYGTTASREMVHSSAGLHVLDEVSLTTLHAADGTPRWTRAIDLTRTAATNVMAVDGEVVVPVYQAVAAPAGCLRRLDAATGADGGCAPFDTADPADVGSSDPSFAAVRLGRHVAIAQGFLTSTGERHAWLSVVDLVDPSLTWTHRDSGPQSGLSNPIIIGDQLIVARNTSDGARLETWELVGGCEGGTCAPDEVVDLIGSTVNGISASPSRRHVAVAALGRLLVVDRDAGAVEWSSPTAAGEPDPNVVPSWTANSVVMGSAEGNTTRVSAFRRSPPEGAARRCARPRGKRCCPGDPAVRWRRPRACSSSARHRWRSPSSPRGASAAARRFDWSRTGCRKGHPSSRAGWSTTTTWGGAPWPCACRGRAGAARDEAAAGSEVTVRCCSTLRPSSRIVAEATTE